MADHALYGLKTDLSLDQALAISAAVIETRKRHGLLPMAIAVLDAGGNIVSLQREDGSGIMRTDIALGKAWGAVGFGIPSRTIRDRLADRPTFLNALSDVSGGRFVPVPGGVLICGEDGTAIGAVGISGDASDKDEFCAIEAIKSVGLTPAPNEPVDNWQDAGL